MKTIESQPAFTVIGSVQPQPPPGIDSHLTAKVTAQQNCRTLLTLTGKRWQASPGPGAFAYARKEFLCPMHLKH